MDLEAEPHICPHPCLSLHGWDQAELPSPSLFCHHIGAGHAGHRHTALETGRPVCLHPAGQTDTQPCRGMTRGHMPSAERVTAGSSMSPSPRCSAASLVNWESEMKHCSSGREELRTLGTSGTPHPLGQVTQGELTPATGKSSPQGSRSLQRARVERREGQFLLAAQDPQPAAGYQWEGTHRNVGGLCGGGAVGMQQQHPPSATREA